MGKLKILSSQRINSSLLIFAQSQSWYITLIEHNLATDLAILIWRNMYLSMPLFQKITTPYIDRYISNIRLDSSWLFIRPWTRQYHSAFSPCACPRPTIDIGAGLVGHALGQSLELMIETLAPASIEPWMFLPLILTWQVDLDSKIFSLRKITAWPVLPNPPEPHFLSECPIPTQFSSVQLCLTLRTPWIAACQASLSITNSQSLLKPTSIELVMPSSHLILCHPLLLLPPIPPTNR